MKNMNHHTGLVWDKVQAKLLANTEKPWSLNEMEKTGGEPDVIGHDKKTGRLPAGRQEYIFYDCSVESPRGRRSLCYDNVFVYHNGADSYYSSRGFRGSQKV